MVGNRGIEPRMRIGTGFTGPFSHQTWRYPNVLKACRCAEIFAEAAEPPAEADGLVLELDVPIEVVAPCLVQKIRREVPLRRHKLVHRWLERLPARFHQPRVLAHIAGAARRRDILP